MPMQISNEQLAQVGKLSLDHFLKNKPTDQIKIERPWIKKLRMKKGVSIPGGRQNVVEQILTNYDSNFQPVRYDSEVTYNKRDVINQAQYAWTGFHDGFTLNEDQLLENGISINDSRTTSLLKSEALQLTNLMDVQNQVLMEGMLEQLDRQVTLSGSASSDHLNGLDALVSLTPTTGTTGGISRANNTYWRNNAQTGVSTNETNSLYIIDVMEKQWRACTRNGGAPDFIMCGSAFLDAYRKAAGSSIDRQINLNVIGQAAGLDAGVMGKMPANNTGMQFKGVPIMWNPVFEELDDDYSPTINWEKRCYFIQCKYLKLRPIEGQDMVARRPERVYNRYSHFWAMIWRGAITSRRLNGHSVMSLA